jgi:hypothetical protein
VPWHCMAEYLGALPPLQLKLPGDQRCDAAAVVAWPLCVCSLRRTGVAHHLFLSVQEFVPDVGVPIDFLRNKLMAKSVTVPGLPAVLFFLTSSDGESEEVRVL